MAEKTAVEKAVCEKCGADVRDESLFCYNCGGSITKVAVTAVEHGPKEMTPRPPLKSAASLRKHRRAFNRQPVEVSWVPRDGSPVVFVAATLVLTVAALVLLLLAFYLR
jgi:hypothetical protein